MMTRKHRGKNQEFIIHAGEFKAETVESGIVCLSQEKREGVDTSAEVWGTCPLIVRKVPWSIAVRHQLSLSEWSFGRIESLPWLPDSGEKENHCALIPAIRWALLLMRQGSLHPVRSFPGVVQRESR